MLIFCRKRSQAIFLITLFALAGYSNIHSQPFSYIEIGSTLSNSTIQDKNYSERWAAENKISFLVSTPFYLGHLRAGFGLIDYEAKPTSPVDFNTKNYSLSLTNRFHIGRFLFLDTGGGFGIQEIAQDVPNVTSDSIERELFYTALLEPGVITKYFLIYGSFEYRKIYNYNRQHIYFLGAGMRFRLFLPPKIQRFID